MNTPEVTHRQQIRFWLTAAGLIIVGVAGYLGFVTIADKSVGAGILVLAAATGFAAFFSPCSFPLLLTFLTRRREDSATQALLSAARVALGATLLLVALAAIVAVGGAAFATVLGFDRPAGRVFRAGVGVLLVLFGLRQTGRLALFNRTFNRIASWSGARFDPSRRSHQASRDLTYGFGYLLAGFG